MTTLISPAKSDYLLPPHQESLHKETTDWLSDLEFCNTELNFLIKLLDRTFLRVTEKTKLQELSELENKISSFKTKTLKDITDDLIKHENHLSAVDEKKFLNIEEAIRKEHRKNSLGVRAFMASVKKIKKEVFDVVEEQMKSGKK